ncbi:pyruvate, phosphate dikinase [Kitasatospora sp. NPDC096147]|uniref:pyruvate, phosphate dikinase n=1 Tax=Kitasatospora sp. NPDC096147 TaxID=3364093 RepID=UPI003813E18B
MTRWIRTLSARTEGTAATLGGKAAGLVELHRLGLPVPAGFVIRSEACRAYLRDGRLPDGLDRELATAVAELECSTGRTFGGPHRPLAVAVRSGAGVSMPGMMSTVLNLGLTTGATEGLAVETGDRPFALAARQEFLRSFAAATTEAAPDPAPHPAAPSATTPATELAPDEAGRQLTRAIEAVFASWESQRARTYRELNGIPDDPGTAVIVQRMVFGNRDDHSGSGVAFSRDPNSGVNRPYGEVLFGRQGEAVVSGRTTTRPLAELAGREPAVWAGLLDALRRIERHYRDACYVEFTYQSGELWLLQVRPGRFTGGAAVRVATELVDQGIVGRDEALLRVSPVHLRQVRTPRIATAAGADLLARGIGACPGVATGRIVTTADGAVRAARSGPVVLVRPETSPADLHGLAAAVGIVTARGGPASHAAVVARAMGRPAVVGVAGLTVHGPAATPTAPAAPAAPATDPATTPTVTIGGRTLPEGTLVTIDGSSGEVVLGHPGTVTDATAEQLDRLLAWADEFSGDHSARDEAARLAAAHAVLRRTASGPPDG